MTGYKVVTKYLKSLGLRKNPNILTFPINKWYKLNRKDIVLGASDWGGIWVAKKLSGARTLKKYMFEKYNKKTRIFETEIGEVLYCNSYRIKTNKVKLIKEIYV